MEVKETIMHATKKCKHIRQNLGGRKTFGQNNNAVGQMKRSQKMG
jgi:hypothetical protein